MSDPGLSADVGRVRAIVGLAAGTMIVASSGAHSALGWPVMRAKLAATQAPADLVTGLDVGWHFATGAMLVFGILIVWTYLDALRGRRASLRLSSLVSLFYLLFGTWACIVGGFDPFFVMVFIVPGALLATASWPRRRAPSLL